MIIGTEMSPRIHLSRSMGFVDRRRWDNGSAAGAAGAPDVVTIPKADLDKLHGIIGRNEDKIKIISDKLSEAEKEKVFILSKVKALEMKVNPPARREDEEETLSSKYNEANPPQTNDEWNSLFDENPTFASDLRQRLHRVAEEHQSTIQSCVEELKKKHPDIYVRDSQGNFILDSRGNVQFDATSEKGKLFNELAGQDPNILRIKNGPRIVMEAMENRLKGMEASKVQAELEAKKKKEEEDRQARVAAGGVASGGSNSPQIRDEDIKVEYNSIEEKEWVSQGIKLGRYKDEKDYMKTKQSATIGYGRGGF